MATEEKAPEISSETRSPSHHSEVTLFGETSPGVKRIEFISANITFIERVVLFIGVFLIAYVYGLDGTLRYVYQPSATNGFASHSLLATITVLRSVIGAAAQPTYAKIADVFGRVELLSVSILFYIIGTIVEATSTGVKGFAAGAVLYQVGYTGAIFLVEVIIGDLTSLRSRLFFSFIPATPFIINTWVSGDVSDATLKVTSWRWGIGMWGIIYPVSAIPLILSMYFASRRAKRVDGMPGYITPYKMYGFRKLTVALFWQLDVIGIILMIAVFALLLVPLTLAGGFESKWKEAHVLAPLIVGIFTLPLFVWWEKTTKHPLIPFHLLKDRAIWGGIGIAISLNTAWYLQGDYLYTVLVVGFNESVKSATRITSFYSFFSVITGVLLGCVVFFVRRLKPFIVFGTCLFMVAFGILINFRGGVDRSSHAGLIAGQVLLGVAGGLFPYPAQASVQAATRHEHLAIVTGVFLASYNIGGALGNAISGAIWNQILPRELSRRLEPFGNATLPAYAYGSPFYFVADYPVGTPQRGAVVDAYKHVQRLLCIAGICITVPLIAFSLALRNPKLTQQQSLAYAEQRDRKKEILAGEENA